MWNQPLTKRSSFFCTFFQTTVRKREGLYCSRASRYIWYWKTLYFRASRKEDKMREKWSFSIVSRRAWPRWTGEKIPAQFWKVKVIKSYFCATILFACFTFGTIFWHSAFGRQNEPIWSEIMIIMIMMIVGNKMSSLFSIFFLFFS
jgi:hypothetical protein